MRDLKRCSGGVVASVSIAVLCSAGYVECGQMLQL